MFTSRSLFVTAGLLIGSAALADGPGRMPKPPQEAYDACSSANENDTCKVSFRGREIGGTCHADSDSKLFCRPAGGPPGGQPPPEPKD